MVKQIHIVKVKGTRDPIDYIDDGVHLLACDEIDTDYEFIHVVSDVDVDSDYMYARAAELIEGDTQESVDEMPIKKKRGRPKNIKNQA